MAGRQILRLGGSPWEGVTQIWPADKWHLEARELRPVTSFCEPQRLCGRKGW